MFLTSRVPHPFSSFDNAVHANSKRGKALLSSGTDGVLNNVDEILFCHVKTMLWTDAFNPLNTKDASLHLCIATIGALDGDHSDKCGYLIWKSLSKEKEDTDGVERRLVQELSHLSARETAEGKHFYYYHKHLNKIVQPAIKNFHIVFNMYYSIERHIQSCFFLFLVLFYLLLGLYVHRGENGF